MESIACIFCHTENNPVVIQENGHTGRQCHKCNTIYISPRPSAHKISNLYGHDKAHISATMHIQQEYSKRLHARHMLSIIKKHLKSGILLEIGAGAGYFLDEARKYNFNPFGIELNGIQADFIRNKFAIPCEHEPLNTKSFDGTTFNLIYHCDVLSHFYDPIAECRNIHNALKDNGLMVFETGNIADIASSYYSYFSAFQYPDHLFFLGEQSVSMLLEKTGFELVGKYRYTITPQLWLNKLVKKIKAHSHLDRSGGSKPAIAGHSPSPTESIKKKGYQYINHVIRYKIGTYLPKNHRPQTIIFVARKKNQHIFL